MSNELHVLFKENYKEMENENIDMKWAMEGIIGIIDNLKDNLSYETLNNAIDEIHDIAMQYTRPYEERE